jgi:hypothetical protein
VSTRWCTAADGTGGVHPEHRLADGAERVGEIQLGHRDAFEHVGRLADHDGVDVGPRHAGVFECLDCCLPHHPRERNVFPRRLVRGLPDSDDCRQISRH